MKNISVNKVVIYAPNWIGDAIMSHPVFFSLKSTLPDSEIILYCREYVLPVLPTHIVDRVITVGKTYSNKLSLILSESSKLRKIDADIILILPNSLTSATVAFMAHIPVRIGYNTDSRGILLNYSCNKINRHNIHRVESYLKLLNELKITEYKYRFELSNTDDFSSTEIDIMDSLKNENLNLISIAPGSQVDIRRWGADRFAQLIDRLYSEYSIKPVFLGAANDNPYIESIISNIHCDYFNLASIISLNIIPQIINNTIGLLSNDSGLAHFTSFTRNKSIILTGPGNPVNTKPYSDRAIVIQKQFDCVPCQKNKCRYDDAHCMTDITVDEVYNTVREEFQL